MGQKVSKITIIPYKGIRFLGLAQQFFDQSGLFFYGNSGDCYLSIGVDKSRLQALFANFEFLGPKKSVAPQVPL